MEGAQAPKPQLAVSFDNTDLKVCHLETTAPINGKKINFKAISELEA